MNLLKDAWIPVHKNGRKQMIRLQDVLCSDDDRQISMPRDDMEMACLQLMVCLTQVIFTPEDAKALKQKIRQPLTEGEYLEGVVKYLDWFELNHPDTPFMQVRGVKAKEMTGIQKLFVGLPEGKGTHCFFNDAGEITAVSESAAAIALFNQAMNAPSMGGGFKGGFRGGAPITTLISGEKLRHSIWFNVLHEGSIREILPRYDQLKANDKPTWVEPIKAKSSIATHDIGLLRGLFWQPAHIELAFSNAGQCQVNGTDELSLVMSFKKEKFGGRQTGGFDLVGQWIHPHSPRHWQLRNGVKEEKYESFRSTAPAWSQLTRLVLDKMSQDEGHQTASVVRQFKNLFHKKQINLMVGGYRAEKASIRQRRHELLPLKEGWEEHPSELSEIVGVALEIKQRLVKSLCLFGIMAGAANRNRKRNKAITSSGVAKYKDRIEEYPYDNFEEFFNGIHMNAEIQFYHVSEHLIHKTLRQLNWSESIQERKILSDHLVRISWDIFNQITKPYQHDPKMIHALTIAKRSMGKGFRIIKGGQP